MPDSQRFTSLEKLYNPWTIRHLEVTGIGPGWQCWEVGGGGGSIAAWLAERCDPTGHVYGVWLKEWRLLQRAVFVIDRNDRIVFVEYLADQLREPDYRAAMEAVQRGALE